MPGARSCSEGWSTRTSWSTTGCTASGAEPTARRRSTSCVDAVEEVRAAAPEVEAVGFGIPALVDAETGVSRVVQPPAARRRAVSRPDERAPRAAGRRGQRRQRGAARRAPPRRRPRRATTRVLLALGTGIGGGLVLDGRLYRGAARLRRRARPHGRRPRRRGLPGRLPRPRLPRGAGVRHGDRRRAGERAARGASPDSALGRRLAAGGEITGALVTELAHGGDDQRAGRAGRASGAGSARGSPAW